VSPGAAASAAALTCDFEKADSGWPGKPEFRETQGTRIPGDFGNPGCRVTPGNRTGDRGNTEFRVTSGKRSSGWLREQGVLVDSGNPEFWVTPGTLSSGWLLEPRVPCFAGIPGESGSPEIHVSRSSRWHQEPEVSCDFGKTEFRLTQVTRSSGWLRELEVPGDSAKPDGTQSSGWLREPGVPSDSENPKIRVTSGTRSSRWLIELGVPVDYGNPDGARRYVWFREPGASGDSENTESGSLRLQDPEVPGKSGNQDFLVNPGTRSSGWRQELGFLTDYWNLAFRLTRWTWSLGWLREPGFPGESGNQKIRENQGTRSSGWFRNSEFWVSHWTRVTMGTRIFGSLRKPRVQGDSENVKWASGNCGNPEFRVNPGTRSTGWIRDPGVPGFMGTRRSVWLREPGVSGDWGKTQFRVTPGKKFRVTRKTGVRVD